MEKKKKIIEFLRTKVEKKIQFCFDGMYFKLSKRLVIKNIFYKLVWLIYV